MDRETKETLTQIYQAAIAAVDPYISVKENLSLEAGRLIIGGAHYPLSEIMNIFVVGAGKAAYGMARAAEDVLGGLITGGAVVTKDGQGGKLSRIKVLEASHPLPDGRGVLAANQMWDMASMAGEEDLVLCLFSGGASALMVLPAEGITLKDKQEVTQLLLSSGADIGEINSVRKHLSAVKGGRLAEAAFPARVSTLLMSDVIGNDIGTIASGPTAPDETSFIQVAEILKMRGVYNRLSDSVRSYLDRGCVGGIPETPKPGAEIFSHVDNLIVASNMAALEKAREVAGYMGYHALIYDSMLYGEARDVAAALARESIQYKKEGGLTPACLIVGGETTVTVTGKGTGGRNQEFALAFAMHTDKHPEISALFAGTDGTDGPTSAAGAFADGTTIKNAIKQGVEASGYLSDNDSYHFFEALGDLFSPGPTGTNVMDIGIILIK